MEDIEDAQLINYLKLTILIIESAAILRNLFFQRWETTYGQRWDQIQNPGEVLTNDVGREVYQRAKRAEREALAAGDINKLDVTVLHKLHLAMKSDRCSGNLKLKKILKKIENIVKVRNKLAHHPNIVDELEFQDYWERLSTTMVFLGYSEAKLNTLYSSTNIGGIALANPRVFDPLSEDTASKLDQDAENAIGNNEFLKSIECYSQAIQLLGLSEEKLAGLYCSRSSAYLNLFEKNKGDQDNIQRAKDDANLAINCRPTWWKPYYSLGCVYEMKRKYQKAIDAFNTALVLDTSRTEIRYVRDSCRQELGILKRKEYLDPLMRPRSQKEILAKIQPRLGQRVVTEDSLDIKVRSYRESGDPKLIAEADVYDAHRFLTGMDKDKQSYEKAAILFSKASEAGNAEAIYNLGLLTGLGKGVEKDIPLAYMLYRRAARLPTAKEIRSVTVPNLGVAEAQFALGLSYEDGIGVDPNIHLALEWYKKSSSNGCSAADNNIGMIYSRGKEGIQVNHQLAVEYWKLAASRGNVLAMQSLEQYYMHRGNSEQAKHWWKCATSNGSVTAAFREELYLSETMSEKVHSQTSLESESNRKSEQQNSGPNLVHLSSPIRVQIVTAHRNLIESFGSHVNDGTKLVLTTNTIKPIHIQKSPTALDGLQSITLSKMDITRDHIYEGFKLKVSSVEDVLSGMLSIALVIADTNNDVQRCFVYNYTQCDDIIKKLSFGSSFSILNPYMRMTSDNKPAIRVDDPTSIQFHTKTNNPAKRCRFCFSAECRLQLCSGCRRVWYCSKECQRIDWKLLKHKLICTTDDRK